jgi:UDP-GlcNAc:undecaprenyl-phosphate GlcNAc-1-phosphate transferase
MAEPRDRDVHAIPTPRLGGLAMYGGVCAAFLVAHAAGAAPGVPLLRRAGVVVGGGLIVLLGASTTAGASTRSPSSPARCWRPA